VHHFFVKIVCADPEVAMGPWQQVRSEPAFVPLQRIDYRVIGLAELAKQVRIFHFSKRGGYILPKKALIAGELLQGHLGINPGRVLDLGAGILQDLRDLLFARHYGSKALFGWRKLPADEREDGRRRPA